MAITPLELVLSEGKFEILNKITQRAIFIQTSHPNNEVWDEASIQALGTEVYNQYLSNAKREVLQQVASNRYDFEVGNIVEGGFEIKTDRESQATLTGAYVTLKNGFADYIDWKTANGWVPLDLATVSGIVQKVTHHVQYSFTVERQAHEAITAMTTFEELVAFNPALGFSEAEKELFFNPERPE